MYKMYPRVKNDEILLKWYNMVKLDGKPLRILKGYYEFYFIFKATVFALLQAQWRL